jgi:hypothetical protein
LTKNAVEDRAIEHERPDFVVRIVVDVVVVVGLPSEVGPLDDVGALLDRRGYGTAAQVAALGTDI